MKHAQVSSYHFREGNKSNCPEIFKRNQDKLFAAEGRKPKKNRIKPAKQESLHEIIKDTDKKNTG